jgi:uncharacterized BrkB/YihY/UPF0761 family membrane protein
VLTTGQRGIRQFVPGAVLAGLGFTALITVGSALVQHQLRHSSSTYGSFAAVIGVVAFLLLLAKLTVYAAELNPVLARELWPRALVGSDPTDADRRVLRAEAHETRQRADEQIEVRFEGGNGKGSDGDARKEPARAPGERD